MIDTFPLADIHSLLSIGMSEIIWGGVYLLVGIFIIYSIVLVYHWLKYSEQAGPMMLSFVVYFGVSALFIISLFSGAAILT